MPVHRTLLWFLPVQCFAHVRWNFPPPRSQEDGAKLGPCGGIGDLSSTQVTLKPGWLTLSFQETLPHVGSPFRIALSQDGSDVFEDCLLLNHIPHNDDAQANDIYRVSVNIPDVQCDKCSLQLLQVMTDVMDTPSCTFSPTCTTGTGQDCPPDVCSSNYFSCANVRVTGSISRTQLQCPVDSSWPFSSEKYIYTTENTGYSDGWLGDAVPEQYRTRATGATDSDGNALDPDQSQHIIVPGQACTAREDGDKAIDVYGGEFQCKKVDETFAWTAVSGSNVAAAVLVPLMIILVCAAMYWYYRRRKQRLDLANRFISSSEQFEVRGAPISTSASFIDHSLTPPSPQPSLPPGWQQFFTDDHIPYYVNEGQGITQWESPTNAV